MADTLSKFYKKLSGWADSITGRMRPIVMDRRRYPRHETKRMARLFDVTPPSEGGAPPLLPMAGFTRDISDTGMAIIVAANSLSGHYRDVAGRRLRIMVDFPSGLVQIHATAVRCQQLGEKGKEKEFLIGVHITEMSNHDWVNMVRYIRTLQ